MNMDIKKFLGIATQEIETKEVDEKIVKANAYLEHATDLVITNDQERDEAKQINSAIYEKLKIYKREIDADIKAAERNMVGQYTV